jgi:hypothetical protein
VSSPESKLARFIVVVVIIDLMICVLSVMSACPSRKVILINVDTKAASFLGSGEFHKPAG